MNLPAAWAWLQANSVPILSGIYFATMGCVLLLAICVFALARQHAKLARCFNAKIAAIEPQLRSADERLDVMIAMMERAAAANGVPQAVEHQEAGDGVQAALAPAEQVPAPPAWKAPPDMRSEIERLIAELGNDGPKPPLDTSPTDSAEAADGGGAIEHTAFAEAVVLNAA